MSNIYTQGDHPLSNFRSLGSTYTLKAIATAAGAFTFFTFGPVLPGLIAAGVTAFSFSKLANAHYNAYDSFSDDEDLVPFTFGKKQSENPIVHKIEFAINFLQLATYKALWEAMKNGVIAQKTTESKFYQLGVLEDNSEKMMSKEMLGYDLLGAAISILLFVFVPAVGAGSIMAKLAAATLPVLLTGRLADNAKSRDSDPSSANVFVEEKQKDGFGASNSSLSSSELSSPANVNSDTSSASSASAFGIPENSHPEGKTNNSSV